MKEFKRTAADVAKMLEADKLKALIPVESWLKENGYDVKSFAEIEEEAEAIEAQKTYFEYSAAYINAMAEKGEASKAEAEKTIKGLELKMSQMMSATEKLAESAAKFSEQGNGSQKDDSEKWYSEKTLKGVVEVMKGRDNEVFVPKYGVKIDANKANTLTTSVTDSPLALVLPEIGRVGTVKPTVYDILPKFPVPANSGGQVGYFDMKTDGTLVRGSAMMAEAAATPESAIEWQYYTQPLKNVGDMIPWSKQFEHDFALLTQELSIFLEVSQGLVKGNQIVNGDGTGNNLAGMITQIGAYTPVASGITDASIYDLVIKLRETIESPQNSKFRCDFAVMNISDINKYKLKKDANNNYIMPPFVTDSGAVIDGVTVIEDNNVVAKTMYIGDRRFARIYQEPGIGFERGYINDDFSKNLERLKIFERLLFLIRNIDRAGFLRVTDIDAALTTLAS
ncbi:MAG: phage major capsid protein [Ekhidna sp.]|nr:phage major capsid protein [Ekhidna sp.]